MYAIQQQALGSIQWTIIASGLKDTTYTITTLSKGVRYAFRVLTITSKAFSKPSPATDPVQLLDRGVFLLLLSQNRDEKKIHSTHDTIWLIIICPFFPFRSLSPGVPCDHG